MADKPSATFSKHQLWPLVNGGLVAIAATAGIVAGLLTIGAIPGTGVVQGIIVFGLVYTLLVGLKLLGDDPTLRLYDDHMEYDRGLQPETEYEDVELIVEKSGIGDKLLGTKSYEVLNVVGPNLRLVYFSEPDDFERLLGDRIVNPHEQYENRTSRTFWQLWPDDRVEQIPEQGIVREAELEGAMDVDLSDINLSGIDAAVRRDNLADFGDVEDAVAESGHAGAFDDTGTSDNQEQSGGGMD
jgi:hypothetical protein